MEGANAIQGPSLTGECLYDVESVAAIAPTVKSDELPDDMT
jgi:hypothetical protein